MPTVIILGHNGRFGRAACAAFEARGWQTRTFGRHAGSRAGHAVGDARDARALASACAGCDVIVHAVNPPYPAWAAEMPPVTDAVIAAARQTGATVLIPGNVYNYGHDMPALLTPETPWRPTTRKGRLRVGMEQAFQAAGVPTIVLRAGDFIEARQSGNWFDSHITPGVAKGRMMYPGPLDRPHAWAYLPDLARAAVLLAERRDAVEGYVEVGFPGYTLTGSDLASAITQVSGRPQKVRGLFWPAIATLGLVAPLMREVNEMRYLWQVPHGIDGAALARLAPEFAATPLDDALRDALSVTPGRKAA